MWETNFMKKFLLKKQNITTHTHTHKSCVCIAHHTIMDCKAKSWYNPCIMLYYIPPTGPSCFWRRFWGKSRRIMRVKIWKDFSWQKFGFRLFYGSKYDDENENMKTWDSPTWYAYHVFLQACIFHHIYKNWRNKCCMIEYFWALKWNMMGWHWNLFGRTRISFYNHSALKHCSQSWIRTQSRTRSQKFPSTLICNQ